MPPASPKTWASSCEAPLTTTGWPPKPGALATKPVTLTTRTTLSRSTTEATAATALIAHSRASAAASAGVTSTASSPTTPVLGSAPSTKGGCPEV